jgi:hypothetical protein
MCPYSTHRCHYPPGYRPVPQAVPNPRPRDAAGRHDTLRVAAGAALMFSGVPLASLAMWLGADLLAIALVPAAPILGAFVLAGGRGGSSHEHPEPSGIGVASAWADVRDGGAAG